MEILHGVAFQGFVLDGNVNVVNSVDGNIPVWNNEAGHWQDVLNPAPAWGDDYPTDDNRDFYFPVNYAPGDPHTNVVVEGITGLASGASILMLMGYHGKGKGLAAGGSTLNYLVSSRHEGLQTAGGGRSTVQVCSRWRHIIGQEGECIY